MSKDVGVLVALPPEVKTWVDEQAGDIGLNAAIWIRMLVFQARKRRGGAAAHADLSMPAVIDPAGMVPVEPRRVARPIGEDARQPSDDWRGAVDDEQDGVADTLPSGIDVAALVERNLALAERSGAVPTDLSFMDVPAARVAAGNVRALRRPVPKYSPAAQPRGFE